MGGETADGLLQQGRRALAEADWESARNCFEQARELDETVEVLDGLGAAAHFQGKHLEAIELKERAFAAYRRRGERKGAAEVARWLAFLYGAVHGNRAAANGWMGACPRDIPHRYTTGPHGCRMLFIFTPGGFEELLRAVSRPAESHTLPSAGETRPRPRTRNCTG